MMLFCCYTFDLMILWGKSDCSPDLTELLSILADLAEKCSKNCGLLPYKQLTVVKVIKTARNHT